MKLDAFTIAFAGALISFVSGAYLLLHWFHTREEKATAAWGAANCAIGMGIAILALHDDLPPGVAAASGPLFVFNAVWTWSAAQIFNRGSMTPRILTFIAALAIATPMILGASGHERTARVCGLAITSVFYAAAALEFWVARRERFHGRWPMIALLVMRAFALALLGIEIFTAADLVELPSADLYGFISFLDILYGGGSAILLVTMLKDRAEAKLKASALTDLLTGLPNRRAFMDRTPRLVDANLRDGNPVSLLIFDLDRFKRINDAFGHPTGDRVLQIFADVLSRVARPTDLAARIGGEEFLLALPGCSRDAAVAIAARIRGAFQSDAHFVEGRMVGATVSAGVATAPEHGASLERLIASADGALYRAKDLGRNRVVEAGAVGSQLSFGSVSRIA